MGYVSFFSIRKAILLFAIALFSVRTAYTVTILVPSQQPTIQAGINAAFNGDTVLVAPGTYFENLSFAGKNIVVRGQYGLNTTVIRPTAPNNHIVTFANVEDRSAKISGFTFSGNLGGAAAVRISGASPVIDSCIFYGLRSSYIGGVSIETGSPRVTRNLFFRDTLWGTIYAEPPASDVAIINNTIDGCGTTARGLYVYGDRDTAYNNIVVNCSELGFHNSANSTSQIGYNNVWGNNLDYCCGGTVPATDLSANPLFMNAATSNYRLSPSSSMINAGNPDPSFNDVDGSRCDLGAFSNAVPPKSLHVPGQFPTIQAAIDSAAINDTVKIAAGTFSGIGNIDLDPHGKALIIIGAGRDSTTIDCLLGGQQHRGFWLHSGEIKFIISSLSINNSLNGAIQADSAYYLEVVDCRIDSAVGDAIFLSTYLGEMRCSNVTVEYVSGAGVRAFCKNLALTRVKVSNCGIGLSGNCDTARISQCEFVRNGWGAYLSFADYTFQGDWTINNTRFDSCGLGVWLLECSASFDSCSISNNGQEGFYLWESSPISFRNSQFIGNGRSGLVMDGEDGLSQVEVNSCLFAGNSGFRGAAISCEYGYIARLSVDSSVFVDNQSPVGAAIYFYDNGSLTLSRSIVAYNSGSAPIVCDNFYGPFAISCTNIFGNTPGDWVGHIADRLNVDGNFSANPLFCDIASGDFHIAVESPCAEANNACKQQVGAFGIGCSFMPTVTAFGAEGESLSNVISSHPQFEWKYSTPVPQDQDSFMIGVGTDSDWQEAEIWSPAPFPSADTFVSFGGSQLADGQTYYLRLRVHNGILWSDWFQTSFRMNSVPSVPVQREPTNLTTVASSTPRLWVLNSFDAESDPLTYDFAGFHDTDCVSGPAINLTDVPSGVDSTGGQITAVLAENCRYWWQVRSFDGFEYSDWSQYAQFMVNGIPESPSASTLISPPLPDGKPVFSLAPTLAWQVSNDPDPFDTVHYRVELSLNSIFQGAISYDSISATTYQIPDSLEFGTRYWWRVRAVDRTGRSTLSSGTKNFWTWKLGDMNHNHAVDLSDLSLLIAYLTQTPRPDISPKMVADLTGNCKIDLSDLSVMVAFMTTSGIQLQVGCE